MANLMPFEQKTLMRAFQLDIINRDSLKQWKKHLVFVLVEIA
jgi:hypothetical protein